MIEVDLCCMPPEAMSTTPAPSHVSASTTCPTITKTLNLHTEGAFKQVQQTSPVLQCLSPSTAPQEDTAICGLRCSTPTKVEDPLRLEGADSATPEPNAISSQVLQCITMPENIHISVLTSHSPSLSPLLKSPNAASISSTPQSETCPRADLGALSEEVL